MKTLKTQLLFSLLVFFLLAGNVNAEGTERATASSLEIVIEPTIELEDWMLLNSDYFNSVLAIEFEEAIEISDWMLTDNYNFNTDMNIEQEAAIELETWMFRQTDISVNEDFKNNSEEKLEIESWMFQSLI